MVGEYCLALSQWIVSKHLCSAIGPPIGGAFANSGNNWRWLFYLNLPLCGVAFVLTSIFLRVKTPKYELKTVVKRMDLM